LTFSIIPVNRIFTGVLQKNYPYLLIKQVEMIPYQLENKIKFRIFCNYRYRITSEGITT